MLFSLKGVPRGVPERLDVSSGKSLLVTLEYASGATLSAFSQSPFSASWTTGANESGLRSAASYGAWPSEMR